MPNILDVSREDTGFVFLKGVTTLCIIVRWKGIEIYLKTS